MPDETPQAPKLDRTPSISELVESIRGVVAARARAEEAIRQYRILDSVQAFTVDEFVGRLTGLTPEKLTAALATLDLMNAVLTIPNAAPLYEVSQTR